MRHVLVSSTAVLALMFTAFLPNTISARAGEVAHPTVVSEVPAKNTPHLLADATIDHPLALAVFQNGNTVYVGGSFAKVENATRTTSYNRSNIFAFDATTGTISQSFVPSANGQVFAVLAVGDSVYIGGEFSQVNGVPRRAIAKINATTGLVDTKFNAKLTRRVSEIRMVKGRLIVGGTFDKRLAALDPLSGADTGYINAAIEGVLPLTTSPTEVYRFAVNPAGDKLVAVGNFTTVSGQNRRRAFMLDLGDTKTSLSPWYYLPFDKKCLSNTPTRQNYLEDVDFSPDGTYFVFGSTGYVPSTTAEIGTAVCDAAARFETTYTEPVKPTWINYTGGDTIHSVHVTGAAVYVQGHFRWLDNPFGKDSMGPGAVIRKGIGAIDPVTGKALPWDPPEPAAQGGQDLLATPAGLWTASDSLRFGGKYHRGIAFAPLP